VQVTLDQLRNAIASHENTAVGAAAAASLNSIVSDPTGGNLFIPTAYAVMLGLASATSQTEDTVTLNTFYLNGNGQDVINAITHELSEGSMGRIGGLGDQNSFWSTMDFYRFTASGQRDFTDGRDGLTTYFSYNNGQTTSLNAGLSFNNEFSGNTQVNNGDTADFTQLDVFGVGQAGETFGLSQTDLQTLEALGWNPTGRNPTSDNSIPAIQAITAMMYSAAPRTYANDYLGNGIGDILWTNGGQLGVWTEDRNLNATWHLLSANTDGWTVVGTGDYDGNGVNDILWQNGNEIGVWTENGNLGATWHLLSSNTNGWSVVGGGDYNGDGFSDILWANGNQLGVWTESANLTPTWQLLSSNTNGWSVVGSGDYNGDGFSDILWSNGSQLGIWIENANLQPTWELLSSNTDGWHVVGSADYNGARNNGHAIDDILWANGNQLGVWIENGNLQPTWHLLSSNTNGWQVTGAGSPGIH
jgi:FG-GAP-like repeat